MRTLTLIILFTGSLLPVASPADQSEYDDCLLQHLTGAKLDLTSHMIKQACDENYLNSSSTSDKRRAYNNCIIEHMGNVESIQAAMDIKSACSRKHE